MKTPRVLAIGAHPDDVEIYCLGLLLRLQAVGWEMTWAVATDGQASLPKGAALDLRRHEAREAGALVGVSPMLLGLMDGALTGDARDVSAVRDAVRSFQPLVIVTHSPDDYHPDHRVLARLVRECCPPETLLLHADTMLGHGFLPDIHVDVGEFHEVKLAALSAHKSQASPRFAAMLNTWFAFRALHAGVHGATFAEGYKIVDTVTSAAARRALISALEQPKSRDMAEAETRKKGRD